jgi:hypothetical protein
MKVTRFEVISVFTLETLHLSMPSHSALCGVIIGFLLIEFSSSLPTEQVRPNVLVILSDDHSVLHVSCYGDENAKRFNITPNLQNFSEQGMRVDRAYTSAPQCPSSRISIFCVSIARRLWQHSVCAVATQ